jgi:hypothetical protein
VELFCLPDGRVCSIYDETIELATMGRPSIKRASHVEPDLNGNWFADLSPVSGPRLGPFPMRSQALRAEFAWLSSHCELFAARCSAAP